MCAEQIVSNTCWESKGRDCHQHHGGWNHENTVVVQSLSCVWLFATPWTAAHQASLSFIISLSLLKLISIESVIPSNHLIHCCPLVLLPSVFPSIRIFSFFFLWVIFFFFCSEFCHTLEWNSHGFTCVPHLDPPGYFPTPWSEWKYWTEFIS